MSIHKILGNIVLQHGNLALAKLENGYYAVGNLFYGKEVPDHEQFKDFNAAFRKWSETVDQLPASEFN